MPEHKIYLTEEQDEICTRWKELTSLSLSAMFYDALREQMMRKRKSDDKGDIRLPYKYKRQKSAGTDGKSI